MLVIATSLQLSKSLRRCMGSATLLVAIATLAVPQLARAQDGGPDAFGYVYAPTSFDFVQLDTQGTPLFLTDEGEANVSLPWSFAFYGGSYTTVRVGANGGVRFSESGSIASGNACFPATSSTAVDLAIFWDDLTHLVAVMCTGYMTPASVTTASLSRGKTFEAS